MIVEIFKNESGKEPFIEWLDKIKNTQDKLRIRNRLRRIELGNIGDYKAISNSLYEMRMFFSSGYRIYFTFKNNKQIILLLIGGDKSSQNKDIKIAQKLLKEIENG
jgi:putative addiction module killer protein